ncbi:hypothetical protein ATY37_06500 [Vibrio cidicii]|uniref:Uncharacterized protein n=1 Tax=Vibrio cidicii TaxID=1763883 RepID=A0A151KTQ5_9VIBR|nr:hypothetical protein [Vibrio cidicii]KYN81823.1 hypothetical protein ATY37_06500 [Vibrio cidicii]
MKLRMGVLALAMSFNAFADFQINEYFDGMYNKNVYEQYTTNNGNRLGFRCDSGRRNRSFYLTFEGNQYVSAPSEDVTVKIKVDSKQIHTFKGRMYSSSNVGGVVENIPKQLLYQLKDGDTAYLEVFYYDVRKIRTSFALSGSNRAINEVSSRCDITYRRDDYSTITQKIKQLQQERDMKIREIESEYSRKIAELRMQGG